MYKRKLITSLLIATVGISAAVNGTIVNEQGSPIKNVEVVLSSGDTVKSDTLGRFTFDPNGVVNLAASSQRASGYTVKFNNSNLSLELNTRGAVSLSLADFRGRQIPLFNGTLSAGSHSIPLSVSPAAGVWILTGSIGGESFTRKIVNSGSVVGNAFIQSASSAVTNQQTASTQSAKTSRASETLYLYKKGYFRDTLYVADENVGTITMKKPVGWDSLSHDKGAHADYDLLFPKEKVNRLDITIAESDWKAMIDDMCARYGEFTPWEGAPDIYKGVPIGGVTENPIFVPTTVEFNGKTWTKVGMRFKGNATLSGSWRNGRSQKLPFKLDFDEFEDEFPEINDQRFYGVRQLAMYNHLGDETCLKEFIVGNLMEEAGVAVPHRSFYEVYVDFGSGSQYYGLYTAVEIPWGEFMKTTFGDTEIEGNVYKPEPPIGDEVLRMAAKFQQGAELNQVTFRKKNHKSEADWSDIQAVIDALYATTRTSDPATWRTELEAVFNVEGFLNYLAASNVLGSSDMYGGAPHNYYLYGDPNNSGRINWIAYDLNFTMDLINQGMSLDMSEITNEWPLIRFLMDDEVFSANYWSYVESFDANQFDELTLLPRLQNLHDMISPYVLKEEINYSTFMPESRYAQTLTFDWFENTKYEDLKLFVTSRQTLVDSTVTAKK